MNWFTRAVVSVASTSKTVVKHGAKKAAKGAAGGTVKVFSKAGRRASGRK